MGRIGSALSNSTGGFSTKGAFSLEFIPSEQYNKQGPIGMISSFGNAKNEYFFLSGLTKYSHQFTYNVSVKNTFGGGSSIVDYGNGLSHISLEGEIYAYYSGVIPSGTSTSNSVLANTGSNLANAAIDTLQDMNPIKKSGYMDFFDLMFVILESRNGNTFGKGASSAFMPFWTGKDLYSYLGRNGVSSDTPVDFENIVLIYHDYDRDSHWRVAFDKNGFQVSQHADDPFTWSFSIKLIGIEDVSKPRKFNRPPLDSPKTMLQSSILGLDNLLNDLTGILQGVKEWTSIIQDVKDAVSTMKDSINAFKQSSTQIINQMKKNIHNIKDKKDIQRTIQENQRKVYKDIKSVRSKILNANNFAKLYFWNSLFDTGKPLPSDPAVSSATNQTERKALLADYTVNAYTDPLADNSSIATNQQIYDLNKLTTEVNKIETAIQMEVNLALNSLDGTESIVYREVKPGETLESIANQLYGDPTKSVDLINLNPEVASLQPFEIVGRYIKVYGISTAYTLINNPEIIARQYEFTTESIDLIKTTLEDWTFGRDLQLDETRDLTVSNTGDLGTVTGVDSLVESSLDRLRVDAGTVVTQPTFGKFPIGADVPDEILNSIAQRVIKDNLGQDSTIDSVEIGSMSLNQNSVNVEIIVYPKGDYDPFSINYTQAVV